MLRLLHHWIGSGGLAAPARVVPPAPAASLEAELSARPDDADLNYRVGLTRLEQGDAAGALDFFHLALHYAPGMFPACAARVRALNALGRSSEEPEVYAEFLQMNPGHTGALYALAVWHHARSEYDAAVELLRPLAAATPPNREVCNLLGLILGREFGRFDEGERLLRRSLEPDPSWPVALSNLGWILLEKGERERGLALVDAALAVDPDDHETRLVRSYMHLKHGDFDQGWRDFEARVRSRFALDPAFAFDPWDGSPMPGETLLIYAEQGLGDQIMFASCIHEAISRAGHCIVECNPKLETLFARSFAGASVFAQGAAAKTAALHDPGRKPRRQIAMGSLPGFFRRGWDQFPQHTGYLRADPARIAHWRARLDALGPGVKIGISWRGGVAATRRHLRSIALQEFLPILRQPAQFISLQYGDCVDDLRLLSAQHGIALPHWQEALDDYDETAALVCALDLVVSVCTAIIHLTGALGRPVWILVPSIAEWRYLDHGEHLPWYPSARLVRQKEPGGWQEVIAQLAGNIPGLPKERNSPP